MEINIGYGTEAEVLVKPTEVITFVGKDGLNGNTIDLSQYTTKTEVDGKFSEFSTQVLANATQILLKANQTTVDALGNRLLTAEASISVTAQQIALKANKTELDVLTGRVTTAESSIIQTANSIASKVSVSVFDDLKNRVSQAESTITQTASQIASKVSQSEFDAIGIRVGASESSIVQTAGMIESKVDRTEFDALGNTVATFDSRITQTEQAITTVVTQEDLVAIEGRLSTAESSIVQNANAITSKVSITTFNTLNARVDTAESSIVQQASQIQSKVSQTTYDSAVASLNNGIASANTNIGNLTVRVTTAESSITQTASQIATKVSQSTFDTLSGTVATANGNIANLQSGLSGAITRITTAESSIVQNATSIQNKVNVSTFNALGARVDTAESTITQQADLISSKVSTTDFNGNTIVSMINQSPDTIKILAKNIQLEGAVTASSLLSGRTRININANGDFEFLHANGQLAFRMTTLADGKAVFQAFNDAGQKVFDIDTVSQGGIQYVTTVPDATVNLQGTRLQAYTVSPPTAQEELDMTQAVKGMFLYTDIPNSQPTGSTHNMQNVKIDNLTADNMYKFTAGQPNTNAAQNGYHNTSNSAFVADGWYVFDGNKGSKYAAADWNGSSSQHIDVGIIAIVGGQQVASRTLVVNVT